MVPLAPSVGRYNVGFSVPRGWAPPVDSANCRARLYRSTSLTGLLIKQSCPIWPGKPVSHTAQEIVGACRLFTELGSFGFGSFVDRVSRSNIEVWPG